MTIDETTLTAALHDLAGTAPDDPARLRNVHRRAHHLQRRHRVVGAGAIAATIAAAGVGTDAFVASGRHAAPITPAAAPAAAAPAAALPACPAPAPKSQEPVPSGPPAIGQQFSGGGMVDAPPTATSVTIVVQGGPAAGSRLVLAVTADTLVFQSLPGPNAPDVASSIDKLRVGETGKFTATRTGETTYVLDEIHAAPVDVGPPGSAQAQKALGTTVTGPPTIGGPFKVEGVALSAAPGTVTVQVERGNLTGIVTFTLHCTPIQALTGDTVNLAGTRTSATTYDAAELVVSAAPVTK